MFGNTFKTLPSKYVFFGYAVRRGLSVMTSEIDGKIIYDVFQYTYLDDYMSMCLLMDDGRYKFEKSDDRVDEVKVEDIISRHLFRGGYCDTSQYDSYDKDKIVGVFGVRNINDLPEMIDKYEETNNMALGMKVQAILDLKKSYMGWEVNNLIDRYNKDLGVGKVTFSVPAITNGMEDTYKSVIGDEIEFFDLINEKGTEDIIKLLKELSLKDTKGEDEE